MKDNARQTMTRLNRRGFIGCIGTGRTGSGNMLTAGGLVERHGSRIAMTTGRKNHWGSVNGRILYDSTADKLLDREYRDGFAPRPGI